jgi:hypothetical protein
MKTIYTAFSKHNYYARKFVSAYVLERDLLPLNPFMNWGYFLDDLVERDTVRNANAELIKKSDELWQFGEISNGCYAEIKMAIELGMPVKFFTLGGDKTKIKPITDVKDLVFEEELKEEIDISAVRKMLKIK